MGCFNHGWFVQAEAPPGAIFTKFKAALIRDHKSLIGKQDIALYFVHWLTDLAGAEPTPLGGCEKFVIKFPLPVLNSFIRSFEFVLKIADNVETEVNEEYLKMRWKEWNPSLGPLPTGEDAIAMMRLVCMAQANATRILVGYRELSSEDRQVLSLEMARTGCDNQTYSASLCPESARLELGGPALLIYYGPAFLQSLGTDCPVQRLSVLAEVYRCARQLWPPSRNQVGRNVIVRVDTIKGLSANDMQDVLHKGRIWVMFKHNESEAFVRQVSSKEMNTLILGKQESFLVMNMACLCKTQSADRA